MRRRESVRRAETTSASLGSREVWLVTAGISEGPPSVQAETQRRARGVWSEARALSSRALPEDSIPTSISACVPGPGETLWEASTLRPFQTGWERKNPQGTLGGILTNIGEVGGSPEELLRKRRGPRLGRLECGRRGRQLERKTDVGICLTSSFLS